MMLTVFGINLYLEMIVDINVNAAVLFPDNQSSSFYIRDERICNTLKILTITMGTAFVCFSEKLREDYKIEVEFI